DGCSALSAAVDVQVVPRPGHPVFYGTAEASIDHGGIFKFDAATNTVSDVHDFDFTSGAAPMGRLIEGYDGKLYGTTLSGGAIGNNGIIYQFDPVSLNFKKLKDFDFTNDANPQQGMVMGRDGKL